MSSFAATLQLFFTERLAQRHQMTVTVRNRKRSASHEVDGDGIKALRAQADLVISGIGD